MPRARGRQNCFQSVHVRLRHERRKASQQSQSLEEMSRQRPSLNWREAETFESQPLVSRAVTSCKRRADLDGTDQSVHGRTSAPQVQASAGSVRKMP